MPELQALLGGDHGKQAAGPGCVAALPCADRVWGHRDLVLKFAGLEFAGSEFAGLEFAVPFDWIFLFVLMLHDASVQVALAIQKGG